MLGFFEVDEAAGDYVGGFFDFFELFVDYDDDDEYAFFFEDDSVVEDDCLGGANCVAVYDDDFCGQGVVLQFD